MFFATDGGEAVDQLFTWHAALQYGALVVTFLLGLIGLGAALNKRITSAAETAANAALQAQTQLTATNAQLRTTNGHTVGQYVEQSAHSLKLLESVSLHNRDLAQQALRISIQTAEELREHKQVGH